MTRHEVASGALSAVCGDHDSLVNLVAYLLALFGMNVIGGVALGLGALIALWCGKRIWRDK